MINPKINFCLSLSAMVVFVAFLIYCLVAGDSTKLIAAIVMAVGFGWLCWRDYMVMRSSQHKNGTHDKQ